MSSQDGVGQHLGSPALAFSVVLTTAERKTVGPFGESEETGKTNKKLGSSQGPWQPNLKVLEHSMSYDKERGLCFLSQSLAILVRAPWAELCSCWAVCRGPEGNRQACWGTRKGSRNPRKMDSTAHEVRASHHLTLLWRERGCCRQRGASQRPGCTREGKRPLPEDLETSIRS